MNIRTLVPAVTVLLLTSATWVYAQQSVPDAQDTGVPTFTTEDVAPPPVEETPSQGPETPPGEEGEDEGELTEEEKADRAASKGADAKAAPAKGKPKGPSAAELDWRQRHAAA